MESRQGRLHKFRNSLSEWIMAEYLKLYRDSLAELIRLSEGKDQRSTYSSEDVSFIYNTLKEDICRKCPRFRSCFPAEAEDTPFTGMEKELKELIGRKLSADSTENDRFSTFGNVCIYYDQVKEELSWILRLWFHNELWKNRYFSLHQSFADYLSTQAGLLENCIRMFESAKVIPKSTKRRLNRALFAGGGYVLDGREWTGPDGHPLLLLDFRLFSRYKADLLSKKISENYHYPVTALMTGQWFPPGRHRILFSEENDFYVLFGKSHCSKAGEVLCGDTFSHFQKNQNQVTLCICDGMGTGEAANLGSTRLIEAFEALLAAGTDEITAVRLLHSVLYLGEGRNFSTLDITSISLKTGVAGFIKAGGAATFIRRKDKIERIVNNNPPPGYLGRPDIGCTYKKLYDGDMVVMLSDGMLTFEGESDDLPVMEEVMASICTENAQSFADRLMDLITELSGRAGDDRTVLVASVSERGRKWNVDRGRSFCR